MRRTSTALAIVAIVTAATPSLAQDSPGFGAVVGGLIGGAINAAAAGRRPRGGDLVPGGRGGQGAGHAAGGHAGGTHAGGGGHKGSPAGGGGQVRRKPGK